MENQPKTRKQFIDETYRNRREQYPDASRADLRQIAHEHAALNWLRHVERYVADGGTLSARWLSSHDWRILHDVANLHAIQTASHESIQRGYVWPWRRELNESA